MPIVGGMCACRSHLVIQQTCTGHWLWSTHPVTWWHTEIKCHCAWLRRTYSWEKGIQTPLHGGPAQALRVVRAESQHNCLQDGCLEVRSLRKRTQTLSSRLGHSTNSKLHLRYGLYHINKHFDWVRHYAQGFNNINSFNPHNNTEEEALTFPLYR